jgi:hypothetical protein
VLCMFKRYPGPAASGCSYTLNEQGSQAPHIVATAGSTHLVPVTRVHHSAALLAGVMPMQYMLLQVLQHAPPPAETFNS